MQALHDAMVAHDLESPWAERLAEWKAEPEWDAADHHAGALRGVLRRP